MTLILSGTNGLSDVDGTAATPAIRGTDTNTGIFFPAADTIAFSEGGAEAMRITSTGDVGIGTSSPAVKLDVVGEIRATSSTNTSAITATSGTDNTGLVLTNTAASGTTWKLLSTGGASGYGAGALAFERASTLRMLLDSSGNLLVGTTGQFSTTSRLSISVAASAGQWGAAFKVDQVAGGTAVSFLNSSSSQVGYIQLSNTATTYSTSSDYRLKENIAPMTGALSVVQQLKPCKYSWKADGSDGQGFIAHELQAVVPDAVVGEKDGEQMQGVDYGKLTPILTAALQEAITKIETLEARIVLLEAK
jgi:hypothetical protein